MNLWLEPRREDESDREYEERLGAFEEQSEENRARLETIRGNIAAHFGVKPKRKDIVVQRRI